MKEYAWFSRRTAPCEPHIRLARLSAWFLQHLHRGFIQIQDRPRENLFMQKVHYWLTCLGCPQSPAAHGASGDIQAKSGKHAFGDSTAARPQAWKLGYAPGDRRSDTFGNDLRRHGNIFYSVTIVFDSLALAAGVHGTDVAHNLDFSRNEDLLFADFFTDAGQG